MNSRISWISWIILTLTLLPALAAAEEAREPLSDEPYVLQNESPWQGSRDFRRILDLTGGLSSADFYSLCLGAHPGGGVEITGCRGVTDLINSYSATVAWRRSAFVDPAINLHRSGPIEASIGPAVGVTVMESCFLGCGHWVEVGPRASAEVVYWIRPHLGVHAQLDAGINWAQLTEEYDEPRGPLVFAGERDPDLLWEIGNDRYLTPYVSLTFGAAF